MRESDFARLFKVIGANVGVFVLSLIGVAVASFLSNFPLFLFLFIVSLLQGGLMVRAFGPAVQSESRLSFGGKVVGWIGFIGWLVIHLINAGIITQRSVQSGLWAMLIELIFYGCINTIVLLPFYKELFFRPGRVSKKEQEAASLQASLDNEKRILKTEQRKDTQHKKEQIRLDCQLLYDQHAHQLQERFPRERLQEYFDQYLSDSFPIQIVEQRGKLLREMIESSLGPKGGNKKRFSSIIEISAYFQEQRKEVELLDYDDPTKQSYITSLNEQEDRAIQEFMLQ